MFRLDQLWRLLDVPVRVGVVPLRPGRHVGTDTAAVPGTARVRATQTQRPVRTGEDQQAGPFTCSHSR